MDALPFGIAHHMGAVPLAWLAWLHFRKRDPGAAWWWLAGAFFISWLADTFSHWTGHPLMGAVYPLSQAVIVGFVFLSRRDALTLILALFAVGIYDVFKFGVESPDLLLRTVAWLSVVGIVYPLRQLGRLRTSLLITFGAGWLCWMYYAIDPAWFSWSLYQSTRLVGILLFCWAATSPLPRLRISA